VPVLQSALSSAADPAGGTFNLSSPNLLLVEGKDDQAVFAALAKASGIDDLQIVDMRGKDAWRKKIAGLAAAPQFAHVNRIALVRDADLDPNAAFQSAADALLNSHLPRPSRPLEVSDDARRRTSILILPGSGRNGALEDLLNDEISSTVFGPCFDSLVGCLAAEGFPAPRQPGKARVQAFLGVQEELAQNVTVGVRQRRFDFELPIYDQCRQLLGMFAGLQSSTDRESTTT
jgi:hypothetical protein